MKFYTAQEQNNLSILTEAQNPHPERAIHDWEPLGQVYMVPTQPTSESSGTWTSDSEQGLSQINVCGWILKTETFFLSVLLTASSGHIWIWYLDYQSLLSFELSAFWCPAKIFFLCQTCMLCWFMFLCFSFFCMNYFQIIFRVLNLNVLFVSLQIEMSKLFCVCESLWRLL